MKSVKKNSDSIDIHRNQAIYYKYRTPYVTNLFDAICKEICITKDSVIMDVGCGRGEISDILSNYAGKVIAVDGSQEMINLAIKKMEIEYHITDLNLENPAINDKINHLFFGRSIHWFSLESLARLSSNYLGESGNIIVCSTQWFPVGKWGEIYFSIKNKYTQNVRRKSYDFTGSTKLIDAGFASIKQIVAEKEFKADIDFLIGHTFATAYGENLENLEKFSKQFEQEMNAGLKEFEVSNQIIMNVASWSIIYCRST